MYTYVSFCMFCILIVIFMYYYNVCSVVYILFSFRLPLMRGFRDFSTVVRQMPGYISQRRGMIHILLNLVNCVVLCIVLNCVVLYIVLSIVLFSVLFVCKCVLYYCYRVSAKLQLNISYYIIILYQNSVQWEHSCIVRTERQT